MERDCLNIIVAIASDKKKLGEYRVLIDEIKRNVIYFNLKYNFLFSPRLG